MPLIGFKCKKCEHTETKMFASNEIKGIKNKQPCPKCGAVDSFVRQLGAPASASKMTMDNGVQSKAVEVYSNIVELNEDRAKKGKQ